MTFANKVLCRVVTLLQYLLLVCSGSAMHGIARKEHATSMGLLCKRGPQLRSVPGLQQEGIHVVVGIARVILYEFGAASEGQACSTTQRVSTKGQGAECSDFIK